MALVKKVSHGPPLYWNSGIVRSIIQVVSRVKDHHMSQVIYANILLGLTSEVCPKRVYPRVEAPMFD